MLLGMMAACQGGKQEANSEQSSETADTTLLEVNVGSKVPDDFYFVEYVNPRFAFHCEYPSFLDKGEAPANGDGRVFSNNELVITVYGEYDELGNTDIKKAFRAQRARPTPCKRKPTTGIRFAATTTTATPTAAKWWKWTAHSLPCSPPIQPISPTPTLPSSTK